MTDKREKWMLRLAAIGHGEDQESYWDESKRVATALERALGHEVTVLEAFVFWEWRSNDYCAGWLMLPKDDEELYADVKKYADELMEDDDGD